MLFISCKKLFLFLRHLHFCRDFLVVTLGIKNNFEGFLEIVNAAADLIHASQFGEIHFKNRLQKQYERYCTDNPNGPKSTAAKFDDHLYRWAMKAWPCYLDIIYRRIASSQKT